MPFPVFLAGIFTKVAAGGAAAGAAAGSALGTAATYGGSFISGAKSVFAASTPYLSAAATSITTNAGTLVNTFTGKMIESDNSLDMIAATNEMQERHIEYKKEATKNLITFLNDRTDLFIETSKEFGENTNKKFVKMTDNINKLNEIIVKQMEIIAPNSYLDNATVAFLISSIPISLQLLVLTNFKENLLLFFSLLLIISVSDYLILDNLIKLHYKKYDGCKNSLDTAHNNNLKLQQSIAENMTTVNNKVQDSVQSISSSTNNLIECLSNIANKTDNIDTPKNTIENNNTNNNGPIIEEVE